ncbi:glycosyltransferase family 25 protein [Kluyvera georgiana]|uniref:glycosyltransferase family 25 protein n=1 Tax=Kluyvera georgiana TaxID=73098 RepID=UPI002302A717|nr:glycosyltransferase family 25 protein [Kluyvera georgiana]MDA8491882.1 glycosyltransferase family 25 protein [Kluyvera georgiana]
MSINNGFPIFIISLKSDIERRKKISRLLSDMNINYDFFDAIDYRSDLFKEKKQNALKNIAKNSYSDMTEPEIACMFSHLAVYQQILDRGLEWALILEDDVTFDHRVADLVDNLSKSTSNLKKRCTYVLGGQQGTSEYQLFGLSLRDVIKIGGVRLRKATYKKHKVTRACSYIVDRHYCQQALNLFFTHGFYLVDDRKILLENDVMDEIYFCDIVTHPIVNTQNSHLEKSRIDKNKDFSIKERNPITSYLLRLRYKLRVLIGSIF